MRKCVGGAGKIKRKRMASNKTKIKEKRINKFDERR
jgi:hypothetical protein